MQDKINSAEEDVRRLRETIICKSGVITDSDLNILSSALRSIEVDIGRLRSTNRAMNENRYEDNIDYYTNKINKECKNIHRKCKIVNYLFNIAKDKNRESLLQYLKHNKPYEKFK